MEVLVTHILELNLPSSSTTNSAAENAISAGCIMVASAEIKTQRCLLMTI